MDGIKIKKESGATENENQFDISEIYTPLSVAKKEIKRRWKDKELRKKVEAFLGGEIPEPFKKEPRSVLSRNIITPNQEFFYFLNLAEISELNPIGLEGTEDKFCSNNFDKASLGKLSFYPNVKKDIENLKFQKQIVKIVNIESFEGKRLCDMFTLWGENLVDFHHRLLDFYGLKIETFDDFHWFSKKNRKNNANQYYENFLLLFLCHGILFENFHSKGKEKSFTDEIIVTNYKKIMDTFKLKPLIVPLSPIEDEVYLKHWNGYLTKDKKQYEKK